MVRTLRVIVALALLGVLAYGVDWSSIPRYLASVSWPAAIAALVGLNAQFVISAWKWQWSLRIHDLHFGLGFLVRVLGIGFFFNHFLPSGIGGDAYRVMKTVPADGYRSRALSAVVVERLIGFIALAFLGALGALGLLRDSPLAGAFLLFCAAAGATGVVVAWAVHRGWLKPLTNRIRHTKAFAAIDHNLGRLRQARGRWVPLISISILFQATAIAIIYLLFQSLGSPLSPAKCALVAAAAGIATVIPVSINGLGVVEGSFTGMAVALGAPYEPALVTALLIRLLVLPNALAFGLMYAMGSDSPAERQSASPPPLL